MTTCSPTLELLILLLPGSKLFLSTPRLQTSRLHRVLRNLCCNTASRTWVLISLISIIQKCSAAKKVRPLVNLIPYVILP